MRDPKPSTSRRRRWRAPPSPTTPRSARAHPLRRARAERTSVARALVWGASSERARQTRKEAREGPRTTRSLRGSSLRAGGHLETRFRRGPRVAGPPAAAPPPIGGARSVPRSSRRPAGVLLLPRTRRRRSRRGGAARSPWRSPRWWSGRTRRRRPRTRRRSSFDFDFFFIETREAFFSREASFCRRVTLTCAAAVEPREASRRGGSRHEPARSFHDLPKRNRRSCGASPPARRRVFPAKTFVNANASLKPKTTFSVSKRVPFFFFFQKPRRELLARRGF